MPVTIQSFEEKKWSGEGLCWPHLGKSINMFKDTDGLLPESLNFLISIVNHPGPVLQFMGQLSSLPWKEGRLV